MNRMQQIELYDKVSVFLGRCAVILFLISPLFFFVSTKAGILSYLFSIFLWVVGSIFYDAMEDARKQGF